MEEGGGGSGVDAEGGGAGEVDDEVVFGDEEVVDVAFLGFGAFRFEASDGEFLWLGGGGEVDDGDGVTMGC